jgi:hypothetical protein
MSEEKMKGEGRFTMEHEDPDDSFVVGGAALGSHTRRGPLRR